MRKSPSKEPTPEEQVILENLALVVMRAASFPETSVISIDDYKQIGCMALLKAYRKFDPDRGVLFGTYAWKIVIREMNHEFKRLHKAKKGLPPNISRRYILEKEARLSGPGATLINQLADIEKVESLWDYCPALSSSEIELLELRLSGHTLKEIGIKFDCSKEWAKVSLEKIFMKIREANEKDSDS